MRGRAAKALRKAVKQELPKLPVVQYKEVMVKTRWFIDPLVVHKFQNVKYFKGRPYITVHMPRRELVPQCQRWVYQDAKKKFKDRVEYRRLMAGAKKA